MSVLEAQHLWKSFPTRRGVVAAVRDVSLRVEAGEVLAFLGQNGAGKTTTIKMLAGLIIPDGGTVRIAGKDPHHDHSALHDVGAVLEGNRNIYWRLTPEENLEYFGVLRGMPRREAHARGLELLEQFSLSDKRQVPVQTLSRGMQQKLAIAVALLHRPKLILLDEPTLGLDVEAAHAVKHLVRAIVADGHAVLLTTHQLDVAEEISDRVAIIRKGEIIAEEPTQELIQRFSGNAYQLEVAADIDAVRLDALENLGAVVQERLVLHLGTAEELWRILDILKPLPLVKVELEQTDLTEVFLRLVREGAHG